jgi:hypothetical protein
MKPSSTRKNSTVPDGVPAPGGLTATVAVIATDSPTNDGFGAVATEVVVLEAFTEWLCPADVLPLKLASPE